MKITADYVKSLSINELKQLKEDKETEAMAHENKQMALKILLNSLYGAMASKYFRYFRLEIAEAITTNGQMAIRWAENDLNKLMSTLLKGSIEQKFKDDEEKIKKELKKVEGFEGCCYSDTDSVTANTKIIINNGQNLTIEDFYNKFAGDIIEQRDDNDFIVKPIKPVNILSYDGNKAIYKPVKYIMKHKVNKEMFRLTVFDKDVIITCDHSLVVERDKRLISIKPKDVVTTDIFISIDNNYLVKSNNFTLESIGKQENWVYDVEVEDTHNFFANDILVHNSLYSVWSKIVEYAFDNLPDDKIIDKLDEIANTIVEPMFEQSFNKLYDTWNCKEKRLEMGREVIARRGIFLQKKRYMLSVIDNEGVRFDKPKLKLMGIEAIKSSTPMPCRIAMKDIFKIMLDEDASEERVQKYIKKFKKEFKQLEPELIAFPRSVSDIDKWIDTRTVYKKGTPIHVRGSIIYNNFLKLNNLDRKYQLIQNGEKIKFIYMKEPNTLKSNVLSFPTYLPKELDVNQYIDYNLMFNKTFLEPIVAILDVLSWQPEPVQTLEDFFN